MPKVGTETKAHQKMAAGSPSSPAKVYTRLFHCSHRPTRWGEGRGRGAGGRAPTHPEIHAFRLLPPLLSRARRACKFRRRPNAEPTSLRDMSSLSQGLQNSGKENQPDSVWPRSTLLHPGPAPPCPAPPFPAPPCRRVPAPRLPSPRLPAGASLHRACSSPSPWQAKKPKPSVTLPAVICPTQPSPPPHPSSPPQRSPAQPQPSPPTIARPPHPRRLSFRTSSTFTSGLVSW